MEHMAARWSNVHFVCISCDGAELAERMGQQHRMRCSANGFIGREDNMPRWGQLGSNGFIVLDSELRILSPCTASTCNLVKRLFNLVTTVRRGIARVASVGSSGCSVVL